MTTTDLFYACRDLNQVLPLFACCWLATLTVASWPAEWARPHHVVHYRAVLLVVLSYVVLSSMGAAYYEANDAPAGPVSLGYTIQTVLVLALCWRWPKPARWAGTGDLR